VQQDQKDSKKFTKILKHHVIKPTYQPVYCWSAKHDLSLDVLTPSSLMTTKHGMKVVGGRKSWVWHMAVLHTLMMGKLGKDIGQKVCSDW